MNPPAEGPADHLAGWGVLGQVAGVVGDVDRVADLVSGGRGELDEERGDGEPVHRRRRVPGQEVVDDHDREDREDHEGDVAGPALEDVQQVVPDQGQSRRQHGEDHDPQVGAARRDDLDRLGREDELEDVVADVDEDGDQQREGDAERAELGARLDHLRQAEPRALVGVQGHEPGAECHAEAERKHRPDHAEAQARADEPDQHRRDDKRPGEPERSLVPDDSVPFGRRHVVNGVKLDRPRGRGLAAGGAACAASCHGIPTFLSFLSDLPRRARMATLNHLPASGDCSITSVL